MEHGRDPCPYRILDDVGGAFAIGAGGGSIWFAIKGLRNSPKGERLSGMMTSIKTRAPVMGGSFAVWGLLFASFDCTLAAIRKREDPYNSIFAGAATGGVLAARMGPRAMAQHALIGGALLAGIEGMSIWLTQKLSETTQAAAGPVERAVPPPVTATLGGSGYLDTSTLVDSTGQTGFNINDASADIYSNRHD
mmetsp:Transcript_21422/g.42025  ORF Transcript_21422/g.42025 Transcript_21422/m.42025 type:complete len:193 (-) Transcript_21422:688-1266(-)